MARLTRAEDPRDQLAEWRHQNKALLSGLGGYARRLVLVTLPETDLTRAATRQGVPPAIAEAMPDVIRFGLSLHRPGRTQQVPRKEKQGPDEAASELRSALGGLIGGRVVNQAIVSHVRDGHLNLEGLTRAAAQTFENTDSVRVAHIAFVTTPGLQTVNLHHPNAYDGDAFVLGGISADYELQWGKIYQSPASGDGPHHLSGM